MNTVFKDKYLLFSVIYTIVLLFFCSQFSYLFGDFNEWVDINVYYTIGKGIWSGVIPYKDLFDHKGPLIFFIYGLGYKITPDSFQGMFIIQTIFLSIALFSVYRLSNLFLNKLFSFFSACIFLNCLFYFNSYGGQAEEFILVFMTISLYLFIKQFKVDILQVPSYYMLLHGILLSATFFIKFNLILFWFFPLVAILINLVISKDKKLLRNYFVMFLLGITTVALPVFMYFILNNALYDFIESYFTANYIYGSGYKPSPYDFVFRFLVMFYKFAKFNFLPAFFIILGVIYFTCTKTLNNIFYRFSILLSFCLVLVSIFMSEVFIHYYFVVCIVFVPLGVISFILLVSNLIKKYNVFFISVFSLFIILFSFYSISNKDFFGHSFDDLKSRKFDLGSIDVFSNIIEKSSDKSLICFGMDYNIGVFTKAKFIPSQKYFFSPNFYPDKYPIIYDSLSDYIASHSVKYIVMSDGFVFYSLFYDQVINNSYKPISKVGIYTLYEYSK